MLNITYYYTFNLLKYQTFLFFIVRVWLCRLFSIFDAATVGFLLIVIRPQQKWWLNTAKTFSKSQNTLVTTSKQLHVRLTIKKYFPTQCIGSFMLQICKLSEKYIFIHCIKSLCFPKNPNFSLLPQNAPNITVTGLAQVCRTKSSAWEVWPIHFS